MDHRYTLEPYSGLDSRYPCPNCNHRRNTFTRYIDTETGHHLAGNVGMCDRAEKCGYHYPPREFFRDNPNWQPALFGDGTVMKKPKPKPVLELPWDYVTKSLKHYEHNHFVQFLVRMFGEEQALELARKYRIGTSKYWPGATVFWQIDLDFHVRTGKVMLYDALTGKRVKEPYNHVTWAHTLLSQTEKREIGNSRALLSAAKNKLKAKNPEFEVRYCFFGEHLLGLNEEKKVCITESEKTAIIASVYYPNYTWIAAGALNWLTVEKCKILEGRTVWLYPDANAFGLWHIKARELNARMPSTTFRTDRTLEYSLTDQEREQGIDLADRLIEQLTIKP